MTARSPLRQALVALLVASTALFAVGAALERSAGGDAHAAAEQHAGNAEPSAGGEAGEHHPETNGQDHGTSAEEDRLLGVDLESTPLVIAAVLAGLALAAGLASRLGRRAAFLVVVAAVAVAWAALDVREIVHQIDESNAAIAIVAAVVAALHLAVAVLAVALRGEPTFTRAAR